MEPRSSTTLWLDLKGWQEKFAEEVIAPLPHRDEEAGA